MTQTQNIFLPSQKPVARQSKRETEERIS